MPNIVVFSPHPDDEVLACGGTIAKKLSQKYCVFIVFMTDGASGPEYSRYGKASGLTSEQLKEIRKQEAINANTILGVYQKNLIFLGIEDRKLRENREKAEERVREILNKICPIEVYFPHKNDPNEDHLTTNIILENSLKNLPNQPIKYQYTIWTVDELFKNKPWLMKTWLKVRRKLTNHNISMHHYRKVHVHISDYLPLKIKGLQKYKSQTTLFFSDQKEPILRKSFVDKFLDNEEIFYVGLASKR